MYEYLSLTKAELESKFSDQQIRISQIINIAMLFGLLLFFTIIFYMYSISEYDEFTYDSEQNISTIISTVTIFLAIIIYSLFNILTKILFSPQQIKQKLSQNYLMSQQFKTNEPVIKLILLH